MTSNILAADYERIVTRLRAIAERVADLNTEAESLRGELRSLPVGEWVDTRGAPVVRIVPNRRFDAASAIQLVPADQRVDCIKIEIDATALKRKLTAEQIEAHMVEAGRPKVVTL